MVCCRDNTNCEGKSFNVTLLSFYTYNLQWGKKVFSPPPIVQVLPLKKIKEASTGIPKKNPENHIVGLKKKVFVNYGEK